jgi:tetratricopeptide (TPR) repeat protein
VTHEATADRVLQVVAPGASIDRAVLVTLLRENPQSTALAPLLAAGEPETVRAAVVYLGLRGSLRDCPVLALYLQHDDALVAHLAEYGLWSIWMQSGTPDGNRRLAAGVASIKNGRYDDAIDILGTLVEDEPNFAEAHFQYGLALCLAERTDDSARAYRQTLRLNPYHFGAAAALGHASVEQGNFAAALHYYRQALRIHPRLDDIPQAVQDLESALSQRQSL